MYEKKHSKLQFHYFVLMPLYKVKLQFFSETMKRAKRIFQFKNHVLKTRNRKSPKAAPGTGVQVGEKEWQGEMP